MLSLVAVLHAAPVSLLPVRAAQPTPPPATLPFELAEGLTVIDSPFSAVCDEGIGGTTFDAVTLDDGSVRLMASCNMATREVDLATGEVVATHGYSSFWQYDDPQDPYAAHASPYTVGSKTLCLGERDSVDASFEIDAKSLCSEDVYYTAIGQLDDGTSVFHAGVTTTHGYFTGYAGATNLGNDGALVVAQYDHETDTVVHVYGGLEKDGTAVHAKMPVWVDEGVLIADVREGGAWNDTGGGIGVLRESEGSWSYEELISYTADGYYTGDGVVLWDDDGCGLHFNLQAQGTSSYTTVAVSLPADVCGTEGASEDTAASRDSGAAGDSGASGDSGAVGDSADDGDGGGSPPDNESGCGCAPTGAPAGWALPALIALLRRRR